MRRILGVVGFLVVLGVISVIAQDMIPRDAEPNWCFEGQPWGDGRCQHEDPAIQAYFWQAGWCMAQRENGVIQDPLWQCLGAPSPTPDWANLPPVVPTVPTSAGGTPTETLVATATNTATPLVVDTATSTTTASATVTNTPTPTASTTNTTTATATNTSTATATATNTPTATATATNTPTPLVPTSGRCTYVTDPQTAGNTAFTLSWTPSGTNQASVVVDYVFGPFNWAGSVTRAVSFPTDFASVNVSAGDVKSASFTIRDGNDTVLFTQTCSNDSPLPTPTHTPSFTPSPTLTPTDGFTPTFTPTATHTATPVTILTGSCTIGWNSAIISYESQWSPASYLQTGVRYAYTFAGGGSGTSYFGVTAASTAHTASRTPSAQVTGGSMQILDASGHALYGPVNCTIVALASPTATPTPTATATSTPGDTPTPTPTATGTPTAAYCDVNYSLSTRNETWNAYWVTPLAGQAEFVLEIFRSSGRSVRGQGITPSQVLADSGSGVSRPGQAPLFGLFRLENSSGGTVFGPVNCAVNITP
jgi:hypothetical protein